MIFQLNDRLPNQLIIITTITMKDQREKDAEMQSQLNSKKAKKGSALDEEDSSEWSLESLEDIKAINIHQLEEEQQNLQSVRNKEKQPLQVKFPEKPNVLANAPLHEVGKIIFIVGELLIVEALSASFVVDLDNWIADQQRNLIGFVIDVLGRIENPYYAIRPQNTTQLNSFLGKSIFYIEGSSKILKDDDIKSMQSKSVLQAEQQNESSSDDEVLQKMQCKSEVQRPQRRRSPPWKRQRRHMQEGDGRRDSRQRTRQNKMNNNRNQSRSRNEQNQKYLQGMYRQHYDQMMRLCSGGFQQNQNSPYVNQPFNQVPTLPSPSIAQFGSVPPTQQQFYGQTFQGQLFNNQPMNVQGIQGQQPFNGQRQVQPQQTFNNPFFGAQQQPTSQPMFNNPQQLNNQGLFNNAQLFNGQLPPGQGGYMANNSMFGNGQGNQK